MKNAFALIYILASWASLAKPVSISIASVAPEGTAWADSLQEIKKQITKKTKGRVEFNLYLGSVAGDEPDFFRKIQISGQYQGGIFTTQTLGNLAPDIRALEVPFNFYDQRDNASEALQALKEKINRQFLAKGFRNLGFYEVGNVYLVSRKPLPNLESLENIKMWIWHEDPLVKTMASVMQLKTEAQSLANVRSNLSSGLLDAAYAPPAAILGLQWQTEVEYLLDFPIAFSVAALLIKNETWEKITAKDQKSISKIIQAKVAEANQTNAKQNKQALDLFRAQGLNFVSFPESDYQKASSIREKVVKKITGSVISKEALDMVQPFVVDKSQK